MSVNLMVLIGIQSLDTHVLSSTVEPPANVTLHCGNRKNILKWEYTNLRAAQGLRFRVDILSYQHLNGYRLLSCILLPKHVACIKPDSESLS